jgi:hypothetical protein
MQALLVVLLFASPSEVIFPPQSMPLKFTHKKHLAKKIACDFCHDKAPTSRSSSDDLIPAEDTCGTCHPIDRDKPGPKCGFCHVDFSTEKPVARVVMPKPFVRFDHATHVEKGVPCQHCHGDMNVDLATRDQLPRMSLCLKCHDSGRGRFHAASRCATCHLTNPDNTLVQELPSGQLRPTGQLRGDAHTLDFRLHHAPVAQNDDKYCANCHRQDFCLGCHNGRVKPFDFHGNDYLSRHPIDARRNDPDCRACHRAQSFCLSCHERTGVVDLRTGVNGAFKPIGTKTFHPAGWADPSATNQPNHHAWQAQRNLRQCVSCHRQETCLECHASNASAAGAQGKMWVNPHPFDWAGSPRCQYLVDRNPRMCLRCHAPSETARLSCQR